MSTVSISYGTSTALTCSLASIAQAAARASTAVDNTSNLFVDAFVYLAIKLQTGTPGSDKNIYVYAYGSEDGTNYADDATGSDAAITLRSPSILRLVSVIATPDSGAVTWKSQPISIASAFNGKLPRKWGIVVANYTNITFDATEGNHTKTYTGIKYTVT